MRQRDLIPFFAMAFLIAWGILALYMFDSETMVRLFGSLTGQHPLFYLAVYAPAIAALTLVLYRHGIEGTRRFLSRLLLWRVSIQWYILLMWPDAQPYDNWLFVLVAAVVVWLNRDSMFSLKDAIMDVLPE